MKKELLLLLFVVLLFQGCDKDKHDSDLVPMLFSQTEVTKSTTSLPAVSIDALVLGSTTTNSWKSIYNDGMNSAKGKVEFGTDGKGSFESAIYYPQNSNDVFVKALAPFTSLDMTSLPLTNKVRFTIEDGQQDIMATRLTSGTHGFGNKDNPNVNLIFDHLLTRVNFIIKAEGAGSITTWGTVTSIEFLAGNSVFEYDLTNHTTTLPTMPKNFLLEVNKELSTSPRSVGSLMLYPTTNSWSIRVYTSTLTKGRILNEELDLVRGEQHDITLTFSENLDTVEGIEISHHVAPWGSGASGNLIIE